MLKPRITNGSGEVVFTDSLLHTKHSGVALVWENNSDALWILSTDYGNYRVAQETGQIQDATHGPDQPANPSESHESLYPIPADLKVGTERGFPRLSTPTQATVLLPEIEEFICRVHLVKIPSAQGEAFWQRERSRWTERPRYRARSARSGIARPQTGPHGCGRSRSLSEFAVELRYHEKADAVFKISFARLSWATSRRNQVSSSFTGSATSPANGIMPSPNSRRSHPRTRPGSPQTVNRTRGGPPPTRSHHPRQDDPDTSG